MQQDKNSDYWLSLQGMRERVLMLAHDREQDPRAVVQRAAAYENYIKGDENGEG